MEGVIAVAAPFVMVVAIVYLIQNGKNRRAELTSGRSHQEDAVVASMQQQKMAEQNKRAAILEAEGVRQSAVLRAEGEKQSAILEADGKREAAFREAEARERLAQAEAKATQMVSDAIASGNVNAINYFIAQKYIEAFKALAEAPNQKFIMMPMESSGVLGSLAGITELAKEALAHQQAGKPPSMPRKD